MLADWMLTIAIARVLDFSHSNQNSEFFKNLKLFSGGDLIDDAQPKFLPRQTDVFFGKVVKI
ncbi:hypothetical protein NIES593_07250 [Hydrococcus rivularis NIES-593]|uniref:Uncharacterized protein n=1 Tax=Hydrococcus rivularis NIES-593 TaxID=1921803 RepID=A0A1U7HLK2_9CYAN|nr:hypothetical protein NIES593_07250 [Hydrococcus rivularis NIES-593]